MRLAFFLFLCFVPLTLADEHDHTYENGDKVTVWLNTVGPFDNHQETYQYTELPFCAGTEEHRQETLGEALQGIELVNSGYNVPFQVPVTRQVICRKALDNKDNQMFSYAVKNKYWFNLFVDDLPVWSFVGNFTDGKELLYTHQQFSISYNGKQIIEVHLTMTDPVTLPAKEVAFLYSVEWIATTKPFDERFSRFLDAEFFEHKIHWFSIFNSIMMVLFLVGVVTVILMRTLNNDYNRYRNEETMQMEDQGLMDEYGWKLVHGDVFRAPPHLSWLGALIGTGWQLIALALLVIVITIIADLYVERASILSTVIFIYALTSIIAGYHSGSFYAIYNGKRWIRALFVSAVLFPAIVSFVTVTINFIAIYYHSTRAITALTMLAIICLWLFLVFPLTLLGTILGRNWSGRGQFPCRVNPIPRPIPEKPWHRHPWVIILLSGILPFGSIFIEIYFIFTSFWADRIYYVYGFMLLIFIVMLLVTSCVSVVATYVLLNNEDHRWHWTSFLSGGSAAFYVFLYAIYYFFNRTKMSGLFQTAFYFGNTLLACFALFLVLGSIGHFAADRFIRRIYRTVKLD